jgi:peptidoglycan/xylan/chitin deacetylase (PgdA/CDA1 family)
MVPCTFERPVVSITFDDYPLSALEEGGPILEREGVSVTFYASFGLANSDTPVGRVGTIADLASCVKYGHELGCHTFGHVDCSLTSRSGVEESLNANFAAARAIGADPFQNFSYPFGGYSLGAKRAVMQRYRSARTSAAGINFPNGDLGLLKSMPLYSRNGEYRTAEFFEQVRAAPGWLIYRGHDIRATPSDYGCTAAELSEVIGRAREIGAEILPVHRVLDCIATGAGNTSQSQ